MGTDINFFVERREKGRWVSCDQWGKPKPSVNGEMISYVLQEAQFYSDRNYDLFAILANFNDGYGLGGRDSGKRFNIISEPRGLPNDLCSEVEAIVGRSDMTNYSPSWLLLAEILAFDWDQTKVKHGFLNGSEYEEWTNAGRPHGEYPAGFCASIGQTNLAITEREMQQVLNEIKGGHPPEVRNSKITEQLDDVYCPMTWAVTYRNAGRTFCTKTLPKMAALGDPDDVRCVFWFS